MILILDCGTGNFSSIAMMLKAVGEESRIGHTLTDIKAASKIILPGVGHFDHGSRAIRSAGIAQCLMDRVVGDGIPVLGICLGMQLLCQSSEEGDEPGLGFLDAKVKKFHFSENVRLKIPHMGWNVVRTTRDNSLFPSDTEEKKYYFVHSYYVVPDNPDVTIGVTDYGGSFCSAFQKANIFGVQFHPEKSHRFGMALMSRFAKL